MSTTAAAARKLKGKTVNIIDNSGWMGRTRTVVIMDVKGKNVLIDDHGSTDWLWLPKVTVMEVLGE